MTPDKAPAAAAAVVAPATRRRTLSVRAAATAAAAAAAAASTPAAAAAHHSLGTRRSSRPPAPIQAPRPAAAALGPAALSARPPKLPSRRQAAGVKVRSAHPTLAVQPPSPAGCTRAVRPHLLREVNCTGQVTAVQPLLQLLTSCQMLNRCQKNILRSFAVTTACCPCLPSPSVDRPSAALPGGGGGQEGLRGSCHPGRTTQQAHCCARPGACPGPRGRHHLGGVAGETAAATA
jgi:hypothetical protein